MYIDSRNVENRKISERDLRSCKMPLSSLEQCICHEPICEISVPEMDLYTMNIKL